MMTELCNSIFLIKHNIMNIQQIMQQGAVQLVINAADLKEAFLSWNEEAEATTTKHDTMLTAYEVKQKFGISSSTLWRWNTTGYLVPTKVGRKSFYRSGDVEKLING